MKFVVILISLILIVFGGVFTYCSWEGANDIKEEIKFDTLTVEQQNKVNKMIESWQMIFPMAFLFGICLFIAGLFI